MANARALTTTRLPRSEELGVSTIVENGQLSEQQVAYYVEQFKGCPTEDIQAFFWTVEHYGLNPYGVAQIYGIPRSVQVQDANGRSHTEKRLTIQVGINGLVAIAQRTGRYAGMTEPEWCGEDGIWRPFWSRGHFEDQERGRGSDKYTARVLVIDPPAAARVGVSIKGQAQPSWFIANWIESADFDTKGNPRHLWKTKPALMLAKVAAAGALRRTFQDDFASLNAEFTVDERPPQARISDLYAEEVETQRPRLNAGFEPPQGMDDDEDEPGAEAQQQPVDRGNPAEFWALTRVGKTSKRAISDADLERLFDGPPARWIERNGNTWAKAVERLQAHLAGATPAKPAEKPVEERTPERQFFDRAAELGYVNDNAARAEVRRLFDGQEFDALVAELGWDQLRLFLEGTAEPDGDDGSDIVQGELMDTASGDPVDQRKATRR